MNKKRLATLMLLACITIGGVAATTYSWFTANVKSTANLVIKTGTLRTEIQNDDKWVLQNKTNNNTNLVSEVNNKDASNNFQNARPGDAFVKTVKIKNIGTLKQDLTFTKSTTLPDSIKDIFDVEITGATDKMLDPQGEMDVTIKLTLKGAETADGKQNTEINFASLSTKEFVVVDANQVNKN